MENRRKRWYDLFGLLPRNLGRLLLWFSLIPIAFIIVLLVYAWRADQYELDEVLAPLENCAAYDRNGQWIGTLTDHDRVYVARNELPDNLVNAFIAREDEDFFEHGGIVYSSIIRSICRNLTTLSYAQGASTITMQLARNCYELGGKTLDRKVLEMAVARRIEGKYSKDEILTADLPSTIPFTARRLLPRSAMRRWKGCLSVNSLPRNNYGRRSANRWRWPVNGKLGPVLIPFWSFPVSWETWIAVTSRREPPAFL